MKLALACLFIGANAMGVGVGLFLWLSIGNVPEPWESYLGIDRFRASWLLLSVLGAVNVALLAFSVYWRTRAQELLGLTDNELDSQLDKDDFSD